MVRASVAQEKGGISQECFLKWSAAARDGVLGHPLSWGAAPSSLAACGWGGGKCILGRGQGSPAQPRPGPSGPHPFQGGAAGEEPDTRKSACE